MTHGRTVGEDSRQTQPFRKTVANRSRSADGFGTNFIKTVPKKTKISSAISTAPTEAKPAPTSTEAPKAQPRKRAPAAPKAAAKKVAASKKPKAPAAKKSTAAQKPAKASAGPSDSDIQLRAYFLAERRMQLGLPGDSSHDWLEARKQLLKETAPKRS